MPLVDGRDARTSRDGGSEPGAPQPRPREAGVSAPAQELDLLHDVETLLDLVVAQVGGSRREGQHAMVREVADAWAAGRHLLVQAGTGTGKSLGYLVPALARALRAQERVVVSTATLALQRQVLTRDLPAVSHALAPHLPREPRVSLLKGWHNYACRHKVAGGYPDDDGAALFALPGAATSGAGGEPARPEESVLGAQVVRARAWAEESATGDRDELTPGVSDRAWRQVSVTALECLGPSCRFRAECFPQRAREAARESDVVVTNHAMLGIAAAGSPGVLPEHDVLVVDEAHELVDRVTAQATAELSASAVDQAARVARRHGGLPTADLDAAGTALGALLLEAPPGRAVGGLAPPLREAVAAVAGEARQVLSALKPAQGADRSGDDAAGLKVAQATVLALYETAERMAAEDTSSDVLWVERHGPDERTVGARLRVAPLSVSAVIRDRLLAERRAVLTSATLTVGGSFDPLAQAVGMGGGQGDGASWRGVDVGSPFDYRRQGILYVARTLPPPTRDGASDSQLDEIAELVAAAGGRTLGLFSSRRAALAAAGAMRERLDVPVLCQGDDLLPALVRAFAADERTCLFGTLSLWQGVDVPGPTCHLVLIDRIPFPRPDDPVRSARAEAVDAAGGNGFLAVSASHAALLLAQGAGRLIRSTQDRGVVAVLDPRLVTARYGEFLAKTLPPFWRTTDGAVARAALRRLDSGVSRS